MSLILLVVKNQRKYSYLQVIFCIDRTATSHPLLQQHSLIIHKEDKQSLPQFLWIMAFFGDSVLGLLWIEKVHPGLICCSGIVQKHLSHQIIMLKECPGTLHSPVFCSQANRAPIMLILWTFGALTTVSDEPQTWYSQFIWYCPHCHSPITLDEGLHSILTPDCRCWWVPERDVTYFNVKLTH